LWDLASVAVILCLTVDELGSLRASTDCVAQGSHVREKMIRLSNMKGAWLDIEGLLRTVVHRRTTGREPFGVIRNCIIGNVQGVTEPDPVILAIDEHLCVKCRINMSFWCCSLLATFLSAIYSIIVRKYPSTRIGEEVTVWTALFAVLLLYVANALTPDWGTVDSLFFREPLDRAVKRARMSNTSKLRDIIVSILSRREPQRILSGFGSCFLGPNTTGPVTLGTDVDADWIHLSGGRVGVAGGRIACEIAGVQTVCDTDGWTGSLHMVLPDDDIVVTAMPSLVRGIVSFTR
jgi:hypothetical protein